MSDADEWTDAEIDTFLGSIPQRNWAALLRLVDQVADEVTAHRAAVDHPSTEESPGVYRMGWFEYSDSVNALIDKAYRLDLVSPRVNWTDWYREDRFPTADSLDAATSADLVRLITSIIRGDRFSDGAIASHLDNGILLGAFRRLCERAGDQAGP